MDIPMLDLIALATIFACFIIAKVYVIGCERLKGSRP